MQTINRLLEFDRVHRTICIPCAILNDFKNTGAAKTLERPSLSMFAALLRLRQDESHESLNRIGKGAQIPQG